MPRVPTYDNFQALPSTKPLATVQAPSGPSGEMLAAEQLQRAGQATQQAGAAASSIALDAQRENNELRVNDAMTQLVDADTKLRVEALSLKGRNALERPDGKSLPDEFADKLQERNRELEASLGNDAQRRAFNQAAMQQMVRFHGAITQHMVAEKQTFQNEADRDALSVAQNRGALLYGDEAVRQQSANAIVRIVDSIAKRMGMSPEGREAALAESLSPLHVGVMKGMIQAGQANAARDYFEQNSASMTLQARATMQGVVKQASDMQTGEAHADAIWASIGPVGANDAVKTFDMERELRGQLKDNPDAMKHGIDALRQRAQAFNAQQAETNAAGVNAVFRLLDGGVPLRTVMRSQEWLALPELKQHEIRKTLDNEAHQAEARALTAEQRAFTAEQRRDKQLLMGNADAFLRYSDPDVLSHMTRTQVEATRTVFGFEGAQHLLTRFDALQKPGAIPAAKMDDDDFKHVAEQMGLDPFNPHKTPERERQLGELKFRVEQLINTAQESKKQALTRDEKMALMQGELARRVTVGRLFSSDVPVIQLTPDQATSVQVPAGDRQQIVAALQAMAKSDPQNPDYAPTESNVRRLYLRGKSRAADLISPPR